jgi:hypothetical protein
MLDAFSALGGLCVSPVEVPSGSLAVSVAPGRYQKGDGSVGAFLGQPVLILEPSTTSSIYLDPSGDVVASTTGFPSTSHVPLATATTSEAGVLTVSDMRIRCRVVGDDSLPFVPIAGGSLLDGANLTLGAGSGTQLGTSASQKLGFWGTTPIPQPGPYSQEYTIADRTVSPYTAVVQSTPYSGISSEQPGAPYAQVSDLNSLRSAYENLRLFSEDLAQTLNALIDDLQAIGLIK